MKKTNTQLYDMIFELRALVKHQMMVIDKQQMIILDREKEKIARLQLNLERLRKYDDTKMAKQES
jgi:hypothetical protein